MSYLSTIINIAGVSNLFVIVAALIGVLGAIYVFRLHRFNTASNDLVSAFTPAIARLDAAILHHGDHDSPDVNSFLCDNFETHSAAIEKFKAHISSNRKRKEYEKAWSEYCYLEPNGGGITLFAGHDAPRGKHLEFIKEKINNILKFARYN